MPHSPTLAKDTEVPSVTPGPFVRPGVFSTTTLALLLTGIFVQWKHTPRGPVEAPLSVELVSNANASVPGEQPDTSPATLLGNYRLARTDADGDLKILEENGAITFTIDSYNPRGHFCMLDARTSGAVSDGPEGDIQFTGRGKMFSGCKVKLRPMSSSVIVSQEGKCACGSGITMAGEYHRLAERIASALPRK